MPQNVTLTTFFRADHDSDPTVGPAHYLAGFEDQDGEPWGLTVPLEPDDVDTAVLCGITFSILMEPNGMLLIEADGRGDAANEAILASGSRERVSLEEIIRKALDPNLIAMEDNPTQELHALRNRLAKAIELVDQALGKANK